MNSWDKYFFEICNVISKKSKDNSTKVGCVIVNSGNSIISTGFNGFPIGVKQIWEREDRPVKYAFTSHAEENAIAFAARNGHPLLGATLYVNRMRPCTRCTRLIIQSGIKNVKVLEDSPQETLERWKEDNDFAKEMMEEAGINFNVFKKID